MTIEARRHSPRVRLTEPAYLSFGSGIRATVLDISETGLRFKAPSAFQSAGSRKLKFTFNRGGEVAADLAWADETGMAGGLRFESISPEVRQQIREWLHQSWTKQRAIPSAQLAEAVAVWVAVPGAPHQSTARAPDGAVFTEIQTVARVPSAIRSIEAAEAAPATTPEQRENRFSTLSMFSTDPNASLGVTLYPRRNRRLRHVALFALVVLVLLASATAAAGYLYPNETRDVMRRAQDTIARLFARANGHATLDRQPASSPPESNESKE